MCLKDMITVHDKRLEYIQDYKIYLIDIRKVDGGGRSEKFSTSLREVLGYIKYSRDKNKVKKL